MPEMESPMPMIFRKQAPLAVDLLHDLLDVPGDGLGLPAPHHRGEALPNLTLKVADHAVDERLVHFKTKDIVLLVVDLEELPVAPLHYFQLAHFHHNALVEQVPHKARDGGSTEARFFGDLTSSQGRFAGEKHPENRGAVRLLHLLQAVDGPGKSHVLFSPFSWPRAF